MRKFMIVLIALTPINVILCKEPELPPCPTNIQFLPQSLPMHCRMTREAKLPETISGPIPLTHFFQPPPSPDKISNPLPMPVPGLSGPIPMSVGLPGPLSMPVGMPGNMPMSIMPMPPAVSAPKLPVIVMPFYSPDPSYKKRRHDRDRKKIQIHQRPPRYDSGANSETDMSSDTSNESSSEGRGWWKNSRGFRRNGKASRRHKAARRNHIRKSVLTPVLQYVTKDGYVIYEKKITKDEAKDWLAVKKNHADNEEVQSNEEQGNVELHEIEDDQLDIDIENMESNNNRNRQVEMITKRVHVSKPRLHTTKHAKPQLKQPKK